MHINNNNIITRDNPLISVILPVYKEPTDYIRQSVESMLRQTFQDFELIIIFDTGINDLYFQVLQKEIIDYYCSEKKIRILINERNLGLPQTLNRAIKEARGAYIARMDADDISLPERLEEQMDFMEKRRDVDLCGTRVYYINESGNVLGISKEMTDVDLLKRLYAGITPLAHPTWFAKSSFFKDVGLYRDYAPLEDYELLCRSVLLGKKISIVNKPLLKYRVNYRKSRLSTSRAMQSCLFVIFSRQFQKLSTVTDRDYFDCLEKIKKSNIAIKLDRISILLDNFIQKRGRYFYPFIKWIIFLISPYKLKLTLHNLVSLFRFRLDRKFQRFILKSIKNQVNISS